MLVGAPVRLLGCLVMKLVYVAVDPYSKKITSETVRFINTLIEIGCKVAWRYRGGGNVGLFGHFRIFNWGIA